MVVTEAPTPHHPRSGARSSPISFPRLERYRADMNLCGRCGDCLYAVKISTSSKPVSEPCAIRNVFGFEAYGGRGRIIILKALLEGRLTPDEEVQKWAYTCTTCGACREVCLATSEGIDTASMMEALRADLVEAGVTIPKHDAIEESTRSHGNPYGETGHRFQGLDSTHFRDQADVVYYVGCTSAYRQPELLQATLQLLRQAGVNYTLLRDEVCCGSVLIRLGHTKLVRQLMERNLAAIQATGATAVVFSCAGCYRVFRKDYPAILGEDLPFTVLHISEYLDQLVKESRLRFRRKKPVTVTYHDPCHLGRHCGVYQSPRDLITSIEGITLIEMETHRNYAHCCGAGGGVKSSDPELAVKAASLRLQEAAQSGANLLVTTCPFCRRNFNDAAKELESSLPIQDVVQLLTECEIEAAEAAPAEAVEAAEEAVTAPDKLMRYLQEHAYIFEGIDPGCTIDYEIVDAQTEQPLFRFFVRVEEQGITVQRGSSEDPDVLLQITMPAVEELVRTDSYEEYARLFGSFYNDPTEEKWIDAYLKRSTKTLLRKGYGRFAREAGLLE